MLNEIYIWAGKSLPNLPSTREGAMLRHEIRDMKLETRNQKLKTLN